ncbi:adenosylmethionine decarboxylase [Ignisphaera sp. 4213-co]|uniref:S-adenosylmethionine decarboxylase proenzyme n=1 Tax=Ignisphaera cupida TaxID=3050454 RepID=A0ABD4Z4G0_9CREN|nr:adenosylmethionine decarboxylase [Ignisphaera sp. 4213-co]MDK6027808.1 adenosylmethionine decarboxylase [Ignisphaera sp. 4213-co]
MSAAMRTVLVYGKHVVGNLYNCNPEKLGNMLYLINLVRNAAKVGNMTLLDIKSWKIGNGVSIVGIVLESHISIHTWPEHNFATVDVYSCGSHTNPEKAFDYIASSLEAQRIEKRVIDRSYEI